MGAISRVVLRIRSNGLSREDLGKVLGVSGDTIDTATNGRSLLNFEAIALLGFHFPEEFKPIEALWAGRPPPPVTPLDRFERIERELAAVKKDLTS